MFLCYSVVISNAASFHDIEMDWNWLAKYLLETLGKLDIDWFDYLIYYHYVDINLYGPVETLLEIH